MSVPIPTTRMITGRELERVEQAVNCPQFGNNSYGEWGLFPLSQRVIIKRMVFTIKELDKLLTDKLKAETITKAEVESLKIANEHLTTFNVEVQAEIERLQGYNENLWAANTTLSNEILEAKAEAIKEFAERLKEYGTLPDLPWDVWKIFADFIDNLVKEMVGDDK